LGCSNTLALRLDGYYIGLLCTLDAFGSVGFLDDDDTLTTVGFSR